MIGTFLDIKGVFNNTPHKVICEETLAKEYTGETI